jgi:uncharacterized membrane-anchored protein YhcB (DUF1043 family)
MKNDELENFIGNNRQSFDDRQPSDKVWARIERALFGTRQISLWNSVSVWRAAAMILSGVIIYQLLSTQNPVKLREEAAVQKEFQDVESYYAAQIIEKVSFIRNDTHFVDEQFTQDFQKLEAMYSVLAEELKRQPSEKVKDALVLNMLIRIDLLNQQIQRLEETKSQKGKATEV